MLREAPGMNEHRRAHQALALLSLSIQSSWTHAPREAEGLLISGVMLSFDRTRWQSFCFDHDPQWLPPSSGTGKIASRHLREQLAIAPGDGRSYDCRVWRVMSVLGWRQGIRVRWVSIGTLTRILSENLRLTLCISR